MSRSGGRILIHACAVALLLCFAGCTAVEHCKPGEVGCFAGPPDDAGLCKFDLVARNNLCVTPAAARALDDAGPPRQADGAIIEDSGGPRPPPTMPCGTCPGDKTCASDSKTCIDFCATPAELPGQQPAPEAIRCGGEIKNAQTGERYTLSFEETCRNTCELACRARGWFCKTGCEKDACEKPEVQADCHARCDKATDPLACVQSLCSDTRATGCANTAGFCAAGEFPDCAKVTCTNSCGSTAYDGVCDDGDLDNAAYASCEWGTDCADCGPRRGEDMSRKHQQGDLCSLQEQCEGSSPDFSKNEAFCTAVTPGGQVRRCVLDCSGGQEPCPVGTTCSTLTIQDEDGKVKALTDYRGVEGHACLPDACR